MNEDSGRSIAQHRTALVAEDEVFVRFDVAEELRRAGWRVIEVGSADEALALLSTQVSVDLVLTDVNMPGSASGIDLAHWLRREMPAVKVAVMSGHLQPVSEGSTFDIFFRKPFLTSELVDCLGDLMEGREMSALGPDRHGSV